MRLTVSGLAAATAIVMTGFATAARCDGPLFDPGSLLASFGLALSKTSEGLSRSCSCPRSTACPKSDLACVSTIRSTDLKTLRCDVFTTTRTQQTAAVCSLNVPSPATAIRPTSVPPTRLPMLPLNQTDEETTCVTDEDDSTPVAPAGSSTRRVPIPITITTVVPTLTVSVPVPATSACAYPSTSTLVSTSLIVSTTISHVPIVIPTTLTLREPALPPSTLTVPCMSYLFTTVQVVTTPAERTLVRTIVQELQPPAPIVQYTFVQHNRPPYTRTRIFVRPMTVAVPVTRTAVSVYSVSTLVSERTVTLIQSITTKESIFVKQPSTLAARHRLDYPVAVPVPMQVRVATQLAIATPAYGYGYSYGSGADSDGLFGRSGRDRNRAFASVVPALSMAAQSMLNHQLLDTRMRSEPSRGYMDLMSNGDGSGDASSIMSAPDYESIFTAPSYTVNDGERFATRGVFEDGEDVPWDRTTWEPTQTVLPYGADEARAAAGHVEAGASPGLIWDAAALGAGSLYEAPSAPQISATVEIGEVQDQKQGGRWIASLPADASLVPAGTATQARSLSKIVYTTVTRPRPSATL